MQQQAKRARTTTVATTVPGFQVLETLGEGHTARVYKAYRQNDPDQLLTLKVFKNIYPSPSQVVRFQQEFQVIQQLESPYLLKHFTFKEEGGLFMIVREFVPLITLREWLDEHKLDLTSWLSLAINITNALADIHHRGVMHGDIKPSNILVDPQTFDIKLIDFGVSRIIEGDMTYQATTLEGTLAYISPEQTGRMNREVDYRSDFYSLGLMLFEMATGRLPFITNDYLELIHAHLAREAPLAHAFNPAWPPVISRIIAKLMAKSADQRYQTAAGLLADLKKALTDWQTTDHISNFELGVADELSQFRLPQKLYGRAAEIKQLQTAFEQASVGRAQLLLVTGAPGIGKSALIRELEADVVAKKGHLVAGKYEQYQRNLPYSALIQSLRLLVHQLLLEPIASLEMWRQALQEAVSPNGQIIVEVIPQAELLLGPQPPLTELLPEQAQQRFNLTFSNFIRTCASADHPLVLFLDDLQWADQNSLTFLELLFTDPSLKYLQILGAYRDTEVDQNHPLSVLRRRLIEQSVQVPQLHLGPLQLPHLQELLTDMFHENGQSGTSLAQFLEQKTGGNPFFVNKMLEALYQSQLIHFSADTQWTWDINSLHQASLTDNVVELLVQKLDDLPENTLNMLKYAACLGSEFDLPTLHFVSGDSLEAIYSQLLPAIQQEFIVMQEDKLRFLHDHIREAVYTQLSQAEQCAAHWRIGQKLLDHLDQAELEANLLMVVTHLNYRLAEISEAGLETDQAALLLELNYRAGLKARESLAFEQSKAHFEFSRQLLPPDIWHNNYQQAFNIFSALGRAHFLLGDFDAAIAAGEATLQQAQTRLDCSTCYLELGRMWYAKSEPIRSIQVLNEGLAIFDQAIPDDPAGIGQVIKAEMGYVLGQQKSLEDILSLPEVTDPDILMQLSLLGQMQAAAYIADRLRFAAAIVKTARLSFDHGLSQSSSRGFLGVSLLLTQQGQSELALFFKKACQAMTARYRTAFDTAWTVSALSWALTPLIEDVPTWRQLAEDAALICQSLGDVYYWAVAINVRLFTDRVQGANLPATLAAMDEALNNFYKKFENKTQGPNLLETKLSWLLPLLDPEARITETQAELAIINLHHHVGAGISHYYLGDYEAALTYFQNAEAYLGGDSLGVLIWERRAFYALTLLTLSHTLPQDDPRRADYLTQATELVKPLQAVLSSSQIFAPHVAFLQAELAYTQADESWLMRFPQAVEQAAAQTYTLLQAKIHETFAQHLLARGHRYARGHIEEAFYLYEQAGASGKLARLKQEFAHYLFQISKRELGLAETSTSSSDMLVAHQLDLYAILKANRAISGQISLEGVLSAIMRTIGEVSGAASAFLLMEEESRSLVIQARYQSQTGQAVLKAEQVIPMQGSNLLGEGIVRYVHHTGQTVLLDDAAQSGEFTTDPYIQANQVRSVLCYPIQEQNRLVGIIYLENNLISHAFTPDRVEVVRLLAGQAAISLQNAQLYTNLHSSEKKYRTLFEDSKDGIFITTPTGQIVDMNPAGFSLFGYSRAELANLRTPDLYANPADRLKFQQEIAQHGAVRDFELKARRKDGLEIDCLMTATIRRAEDGTILGYEGIIRDITAQKRAEKERLQLSAIQRELTIAQSIQQSLLPPARPDWTDLNVICYSQAAREVGGDLYAYHAFEKDEGGTPITARGQMMKDEVSSFTQSVHPSSFAVALGDISGKGMPAALLMAVSLASLRSIVRQGLAPGELLTQMDSALSDYTYMTNQNCALVYVEITRNLPVESLVEDEISYTLRVANAGCVTPLIRRANGTVEWVEAFGLPLGMELDERFGYNEVTVRLSKGDLVILTSDGVIEANNAADELFSFDRLEQAAIAGPTTSAEAMLEHLKAAVAAFVGPTEPRDDITIVVVQV